MAAETNDSQTENKESEKKEEEDEELDLNKGLCVFCVCVHVRGAVFRFG